VVKIIHLTNTNQPPIADAGIDDAYEATSPQGAEVLLDGSDSSDPDGDALIYTWSENGTVLADPTIQPESNVTLGLGLHLITLTVDDSKGGVSTNNVTITVMDTQTPVISVVIAPGQLWPPNHKMVPVHA
jgi:hypothetical protein